MKNNRRDFLKAIGIGSSALLVDPVIAKTFSDRQIKEIESKGPESVFAIRSLETDYVVAGNRRRQFLRVSRTRP